MKRKIVKLIVWLMLSVALSIVILIFEINQWPAGSSISGVLLGFILPAFWRTCQDITDTNKWKTSQRKLQRGGFIDDNTEIRVSFAYLFRIKVNDRYFLVQNGRNTGKYQPVGGVYKMHGNEKFELKNLFHVSDDNKIPIDESSRDDYRLIFKNKYLRKFVKRFDNEAYREKVSDLSREFKEELVDTGILDWRQIRYRVCGRHLTELKFGEHFQIYELLLADIAELELTPDQENDLKKLLESDSDLYRFATADEIKHLGLNIGSNDLRETIGDHTVKILQETEDELIKLPESGKEYTVRV